jgi:hypothetical protein
MHCNNPEACQLTIDYGAIVRAPVPSLDYVRAARLKWEQALRRRRREQEAAEEEARADATKARLRELIRKRNAADAP